MKTRMRVRQWRLPSLKTNTTRVPSPKNWVWLKIKLEGRTAGFGPCFHLPGFHFGTGFLSHSQLQTSSPSPKNQPASNSEEALVLAPVNGLMQAPKKQHSMRATVGKAAILETEQMHIHIVDLSPRINGLSKRRVFLSSSLKTMTCPCVLVSVCACVSECVCVCVSEFVCVCL